VLTTVRSAKPEITESGVLFEVPLSRCTFSTRESYRSSGDNTRPNILPEVAQAGHSIARVRQLRHPCPGDPSGGAHPVNRPWNAREGVSHGQSIDVLRKWSAQRRVPWDSEGRAADDIWRTSGNARPCFSPARRRWRRIGSGAECCEYQAAQDRECRAAEIQRNADNAPS
jgi:hypothetical protein